MIKLIIKTLLLINIFIPIAFAQSVSLNDSLQGLTNQFLKNLQTDDSPVTAVEVSVLLPNEKAPRDFVAGQAINSGKQATTNQMVQYGSISKEYTSLLLLKSIEDGDLSFETPLKDIFPEKFSKKTWPSQWKEVTLTQLLNMTSGITTYSMPKIIKKINPYYTGYDLEQLISYAAAYQIRNGCHPEDVCFEPGTNWGYSNTNYIIAGMIIEKYSNMSFEEAIKTHILDPFKQAYGESIYYALQYDNTLYPDMIHGYLPPETAAEIKSPLLSANQDVTALPLAFVGPAGALTGTTHALTLLTRALFDSQLFKEKKALFTNGFVLPANQGEKVSVDEINQKCTIDKKGCFGLGVGVIYDKNHGQIWMYTGNYLGYVTTYAYFKSTKTIIVISQNAGQTEQLQYLRNQTIFQIYNEVLTHMRSIPDQKKTVFVNQPTTH